MDVRCVYLEKFEDARGTLYALQDFPFDVKRIFTIADVGEKEKRGGHAHRKCEQVICCTRGSAVLEVSDGKSGLMLPLPAGKGFHVPAMHWIVLRNFAPGTAIVVAASERYTPPIRDEAEFLRLVESGSRDAKDISRELCDVLGMAPQ